MLDTPVSYITSFNEPPGSVPLGKALDSFTRQTRHELTINQLRQIAPRLASAERGSPEYEMLKEEKSCLKKTLPAFQFGGVFNGSTKAESLVPGTQTGIVSLDFDADGNPEVSDWPHFRNELFKLRYVFFSALSVSGAGAFTLIRVKYPDRQRQHFEQLKRDFAALYERFGFQAIPDKSKGQNVQQLRFLSFDPEAKRRAPEAVTIYDRLPQRKRPARSQPGAAGQLTGDVFGRAVQVVRQKRDCTFTQGTDMHNSIFHLCKTLNYWGIAQHEAEAFISSEIMPLSQITSNCISDPYRRYAADFGAGALRQPTQFALSVPNVRPPNVTMPAPATPSLEPPECINPATGEVFDYPPYWDIIEPPEANSPEYRDMLKAELDAGAELSLHELCLLDAKIRLIAKAFNVSSE